MTARPFDPSVHPAAAVWPMLPDDELERLAESIRTNGLLEPIVLTSDGQLLDGRNRLAACLLAKVKPTTVTFDGDPVEYVLARNNDRRHMSTGQRAMATALTLAQDGKRSNGRWKRGSVPVSNGESANSWEHRVKEAGVVLDDAPDLAPLVVAGTVVLSAAYLTARDRRAHADSEQARMDRLAEAAPDLAGQVRDETLTLTEAEAATNQRAVDNARDRRDGRLAADRLRASLLGDVATIGGAIQLGEQIDTTTLIDTMHKALDALEDFAQ